MPHNRIVILEDELIALVTPEMSDLDAMTRGVNNLENAKYITLDMPKGVMGHAIEGEYLKSLVSQEQKHSFMILCKDMNEGMIVGSIGLNSLSEFNRNASLGILLYGDQTGKGIGTRSLNLVLSYAFEYLHLHKVSLVVRGDNARAINCYVGCGFQECGRQREHVWIGEGYADRVHMEILRCEWISRAI